MLLLLRKEGNASHSPHDSYLLKGTNPIHNAHTNIFKPRSKMASD